MLNALCDPHWVSHRGSGGGGELTDASGFALGISETEILTYVV